MAENWPFKTVPSPNELEIQVLSKIKKDTDKLREHGITRYLERGHIKHSLLMYLAEDIWPVGKLAEFFQVSDSSIAAFARRHENEIAELRAQMQDETRKVLSALWIARKDWRLSEYQQSVEDIEEWILREIQKGKAPDIGMLRAKFQALHNVAEELGELPPRVAIENNQTTVRYTLEGVNLDEL